MNKILLFLLIIIYFLLTYEPYNNTSKGIVLIGVSIMAIISVILYFASIIKYKLNVLKIKYSFDFIGLFFIWILITLILISGILSPKEFDNVLPLLSLSLIQIILFGVIFKHYNISIVKGMDYFAYFSFIFGLLAAVIANYVYWYENINYGFISIGMYESYERAYSWFANPNYLGNMLAIAILCNFFLINKENHWLKNLILIISLPFLTITLLLTGSKAGLLTAIIGIIFYLILIHKFNFIKILASKHILLSLILGVIVILILIYVTDFSHYIEDILRLGNEEEKRLNYWLLGMDLLYAGNSLDMMLGNGYDFMYYITGSSAHNTYIELLVNQGIIFTLIMLVTIAYVPFKSIKKLKGKEGLYAKSLIQSIFLMLIIFSMITTVLFDLRFEYYAYIYIFTIITFSNNKNTSLID